MKKIIITLFISLLAVTTLQASTLKDFIVSGNTFWSEGKFAEAEAEFNKALKIDPDYSIAHARMANLYLTQNKTSEAVESFQNAINGDPENAHLFVGLAITYLHKQYYKMADAMIQQALAINPDFANAKKLQTYVDAKSAKMDQAVTAALPLDSTHGQASPHGQANNSALPATIQKNIQKSH